MRRKLKIIIPAIVVVFIGFMAYKTYGKIIHKQQIAENIQTLPAFYFYDMQDSLFTDADLLPGKATLIINFHPECGHCQYEAKIIGERVNDFDDFQLLWISYAEKEVIKTFANKHKLTGYQNITFLEDKDMVFDDIFGKSGIPTSFIYNKNGKLLKQFKGEIKVEALLENLGR